MKIKNTPIRYWLILTLLLAALFLVACSSAGGSEPAADEQTTDEMEHDEEMGHDEEETEHDESEEHHRVPNQDGATIRLVSPADGDTFSTLDQIIVEIEVENFELGEGNHWHVYVDDVSYGMVMGDNTDQALPGLEPGEHEISVYMSIGTHEEYEDGDSVTIVVEE